jgi:adenylate cyclase
VASTQGLSLRTKWTFSVLVLALVPMVILGVDGLRIQRDGLGRVERELEAAIVDEASARVVTLLTAASTLAARTAASLADDDADVDERMKAIRSDAERTPMVSSVAFFDKAGTFIDAFATSQVVEAALHVPPAPGQDGVFRVLPLPDGSFAIRCEQTIAGARGGFVVVTFAPDALTAKLRELSVARFGAPNRLYLVDRTAHIIAGDTQRPSERPAILDASRWPAEAFAGELVVASEFDDGVAKIGTVRTMPEQKWAVVVERPVDEAFAALASARRAFFVSLAGFAVIVAAAGVLLARRALRPVGALVRLIERYGHRQFQTRSEVRSRDELEALGTSLERMADELSASELEIKRRATVEANLARYLPEAAAQAIIAKEGELELGGARRTVTVLFADVVAFTGFAERTSPERVVAFLNELFTMLSECVFRHDGMVDKFIGDCIMATFLPSGGDEAHVRSALLAAEDMHRFVESNGPRWKEEYDFEVRLGIGVATGPVLLGNLGSESRMEYTVIGDVVNVAARLEALALPNQTLTTPDVAAACPEFSFASLGEHTLRGRASPMAVMELLP